jgi:hypothetical protein
MGRTFPSPLTRCTNPGFRWAGVERHPAGPVPPASPCPEWPAALPDPRFLGRGEATVYTPSDTSPASLRTPRVRTGARPRSASCPNTVRRNRSRPAEDLSLAATGRLSRRVSFSFGAVHSGKATSCRTDHLCPAWRGLAMHRRCGVAADTLGSQFLLYGVTSL